MSFFDDDESLVKAALGGSVHAWEKLVKRYEKTLYNYGLRISGNKSDAMDLMQEVFIGVYRNLHSFRGDAKFSSWLFRIAHNKAIDIGRRNAILKGRVSSLAEKEVFEGQLTLADAELEPDRCLSNKEQNQYIQALLKQLPVEQRLVVELKVFQSLTFDEIAQMQEISENTAKTRFYNALRKMRLVLENSHVLS